MFEGGGRAGYVAGGFTVANERMDLLRGRYRYKYEAKTRGALFLSLKFNVILGFLQKYLLLFWGMRGT